MEKYRLVCVCVFDLQEVILIVKRATGTFSLLGW